MPAAGVSSTMSKHSHTGLIKGLGYAGLIPFAASALASYLGLSFLGLDAARWFSGYSAVILVFLSGSLWGLVLGKAGSNLNLLLLAFSNAMALFVWLALGLAENYYLLCLVLLMVGYAVVLGIEIVCVDLLYDEVEADYLTMRLILTTLVIVLHATTAVAVFSK
jgi:hypothetical protein